MKKYTQNTFNSQQLLFFKKLHVSQIIQLLKQNPILRQNEIFFQNIQIKQLQKLITKIFQQSSLQHLKPDTIHMLINIMKQKTTILDTCFAHSQFNPTCIFSILHSSPLQYSNLIILEDILLPYVRKMPHKVMEIICNDIELQQLIFKNVYEKPIFKIIYTMIFCLSKKYSEIYKLKIRYVINELLQLPFRYLNQIQGKNKPVLQLTRIKSLNYDFLQQQKKKSCVINSHRHLSNFGKAQIPHKFNLKTQKSIKLSQKEISQQSNNIINSNSNHNHKPKHIKNTTPKDKPSHNNPDDDNDNDNDNESQNSLQKQISQNSQQGFTDSIGDKLYDINAQLDYYDLTENIKMLFHDLMVNIDSIYLKNLIVLLSKVNSSYLNRLINNFEKYSFNNQQEYQGYCQGIIDVLESFIEFYQKINQIEIKQNQYEKKQAKIRLNTIIKSLFNNIYWMKQYILKDNQQFHCFSSGEKIKKVGMVKYKMICLIVKLLHLNQFTSQDIVVQNSLQSIQFQFNSFRFSSLIKIIQKYLSCIKWNNILHQILIKLTQIVLSLDYQGFRRTYLTIQNPQNSFLGLLVQNFNNKKFIYLQNMTFSTYGNISFIYQISYIIIQSLRKHENDIEILIQKFPYFQIYINKDLYGYQKQQTKSQFMDEDYIEPDKHIIHCILQPENVKMLNQPLQEIQNYIEKISISNRWSHSLTTEDEDEQHNNNHRNSRKSNDSKRKSNQDRSIHRNVVNINKDINKLKFTNVNKIKISHQV